MRSAQQGFLLFGCKLTRRDLDAILRTAAAGASNDARISVSTTQGISKVEATTLDELFNEIDNPARIANLDINVHDQGSQPGTYVGVSLDPLKAWVYASGPDETWVLGRSEQLKALLQGTRLKLTFNAEYGSSTVAGFVPRILELAILLPGLIIGFTWPVWVALFVAGIGLTFFTWRWLYRRNTKEILLSGTFRKTWSRGDKIHLAVLIVSIAALFFGVLQPWLSAHH